MKPYKPNTKLYAVLLIISTAVIGGAYAIPITYKSFTIVAGIGCGGVASVFVAWLVEAASCRHQNESNRRLSTYLLEKFDCLIKVEMQKTLAHCAQYQDFDIDAEYSLDNILAFCRNMNDAPHYIYYLYDEIGKMLICNDLRTLLITNPVGSNIELFSTFERCAENYKGFKNIEKVVLDDSKYAMADIFFGMVLEDVNHFYKLRGMSVSFSIRNDHIQYVEAFRKARKTNKSQSQNGGKCYKRGEENNERR